MGHDAELAENDKDPDAVLDYGRDWSEWLGEGETITAHTVSLTDVEGEPSTAVTIDSDAHTDTTTTAWISGGTAGETVLVVFHVVTSAGREDDRSVRLNIVER